jgi:hypothetical protein
LNLDAIYNEVKQLLSISDSNSDLEQNINHYYKREPDENKLEILGDILSFVDKFSMFSDIKPFMNSLYTCINNTLEIRPECVYDFEELLMKNSIYHFVNQYINYSKITQKDQVLDFLTGSLEKLKKQPLITNLGLLLKPMYQDQKYLDDLERLKEIEVDYHSNNNVDIKLKQQIDKWLATQIIDLNKQDELKNSLQKEFQNLISKYDLGINSEKAKKLEIDVLEMLAMRLTMESLMEHMQEDSFEPIPIK